MDKVHAHSEEPAQIETSQRREGKEGAAYQRAIIETGASHAGHVIPEREKRGERHPLYLMRKGGGKEKRKSGTSAPSPGRKAHTIGKKEILLTLRGKGKRRGKGSLLSLTFSSQARTTLFIPKEKKREGGGSFLSPRPEKYPITSAALGCPPPARKGERGNRLIPPSFLPDDKRGEKKKKKKKKEDWTAPWQVKRARSKIAARVRRGGGKKRRADRPLIPKKKETQVSCGLDEQCARRAVA